MRRLILKLFRRRRLERDLEAELAFHQEQAAMGGNPIPLGNRTKILEASRDSWRFVVIEDLWRDFVQGLRMSLRHPGLTIIAVLSIALGIGVNTAVFTVGDALILEPLPVEDPDRLVVFRRPNPDQPDEWSDAVSYGQFQRITEGSRALAGTFVVDTPYLVSMTSNGGGATDGVMAVAVSGSYFSTLRVDAEEGRVLTGADDRADATPVVVISHRLWQSQFGGSAEAIGSEIVLSYRRLFQDTVFTIVGVAPPDFHGVDVDVRADLWWPYQQSLAINSALRAIARFMPNWEGRILLRMMGRLRPGMTSEQVQAEVDVLAREADADATGSDGMASRVRVMDGSTGFSRLRFQFSDPLAILAGAAALVLSIACANVGSLMLARGIDRRGELALRMTLGARRLRIARQLFIEALIPAGAGGLGGLALANLFFPALLRYLPSDSGFPANVGINGRVLVFAVGITLASALLFGLLPALRVTRMEPNPIIEEHGTQLARTARRASLNRLIVVGQVAFTLVMLVGASLFFSTLQNLREVDTGFDKDVIQFTVETAGSEDIGNFGDFTDRLRGRIDALPDVESFSYSSWFGLLGGPGSSTTVQVNEDAPLVQPAWFIAGPGFFETMGIRVLDGRGFQASDDTRDLPAVVIGQQLASDLFGESNAIGRRVIADEETVEVVGVVEDIPYENLREQAPATLYEFFTPFGETNTRFAVRANSDPARLMPLIRSVVPQVDSRVRVRNIQTIGDVVENTLVRERFIAQLIGVLGMFAWLLTSIGLYGLFAYLVAVRTGEIGLRMALGARQGHIIGMVFRETAPLLIGGVALGLAGSVAATRFVSHLLFGVSPQDPKAIGLAIAILTLATAVAVFMPARRASRVDPLTSLREN